MNQQPAAAHYLAENYVLRIFLLLLGNGHAILSLACVSSRCVLTSQELGVWTRRLAPAPGEWALGARQAHPWGPERGGGGSSGTRAELCAAAGEHGLEHPQCASASAGTRRSTHTRPRVFTRSTRHPHPLPSSQPRRCPQAASVQGSLGENWRPGLAPGPRGREGGGGIFDGQK